MEIKLNPVFVMSLSVELSPDRILIASLVVLPCSHILTFSGVTLV